MHIDLWPVIFHVALLDPRDKKDPARLGIDECLSVLVYFFEMINRSIRIVLESRYLAIHQAPVPLSVPVLRIELEVVIEKLLSRISIR